MKHVPALLWPEAALAAVGSSTTLAETEQRLQLALHAARLGLWELSLPDQVLVLSDTALEITGLTRAQLAREPLAFRRLVHPDDVESLWALDDATRHGRSFSAEYRIVRPDGQVRWVAQHARALCDGDGRSQRLIGTLVDVTATKQTEHELRRVKEQLEARVLERTDALAEANTALINEVAERRAAELHARELMSQLVNAEEDERRRLSREMHDTLGQHLAALGIGLESIVNDPQLPAALRERVLRLKHSAQQLEDGIDQLAHELRPSELDDLGLDDALRQHAGSWSVDSGVAVEVYTHALDNKRFAPALETTVFRVAQEALTNVRKHAKAAHVSVIVEHRGGELRLIVEDDGCGFDAAARSDPPSLAGTQLGLRGMAERARLVGGRLEIESVAHRGGGGGDGRGGGRGTTVFLSIPLQEPV